MRVQMDYVLCVTGLVEVWVLRVYDESPNGLRVVCNWSGRSVGAEGI